MKLAYDESELVHNRASLLLYGGTVADRRAWAEEARSFFEAEGPLVEVDSAAKLGAALALKRGVVYVPDVVVLGRDAQAQVLRCLQLQEERPKLVLGLTRSVRALREDGSLREDLLYRLHQAQVDLGEASVQAGIKARRTARSARTAPGKSRPVAPSRSAVRTPRTAAAKVKTPARRRR